MDNWVEKARYRAMSNPKLPVIPTRDLCLRNRYDTCGEDARYGLSPPDSNRPRPRSRTRPNRHSETASEIKPIASGHVLPHSGGLGGCMNRVLCYCLSLAGLLM